MKTSLFINILTLGLLLAAGPIAFAADETNSDTRLDSSSFDILSQRNIFNPNRRSRQTNNTVRPARVDSFTLVGTMAYDKGNFAFFDGTRSDYRKALKPSDTIAGYHIAAVLPNSIKLSASSNQTINFGIGMQMRSVDGGPWTLAYHAEPATNDAVPTDNPDISAKAATLNGAQGDALKRLLMRRMQEK